MNNWHETNVWKHEIKYRMHILPHLLTKQDKEDYIK